MATGTQLATIKKTADNTSLYGVSLIRNTATYPLTVEGDTKLAADIAKGYFRLVVDNGAVIPAGTVPPLTKPAAPTSGAVAAYSRKIQAESASGTGTWNIGQEGDGTTRGGYTSSSDHLTFTLSDIPITASNFSLDVRYQTNYDTPIDGLTGLMRVIVNGGTPLDLVTQGAAGGMRTLTIPNLSLEKDRPGGNTIRFEGLSRTYFLDYIVVSRPASS